MTIAKFAGVDAATGKKSTVQSRNAKKAVQKREIMKSMRVDTYTCEIIERAAAITGDSFTHFVIQAAMAKAQNALIDEAFFPISEEAYSQLGDMLEKPPELSERMKAEIQSRRLSRSVAGKHGRAA